ncbi:MAG: glycosyltransferase, partial [Ruminococcus sp.]|nr:glycosyltransferase [Ruminococcus sp.]
CTPDNSMKIVREYANKYKSIRYIDLPQNSGPMVARHIGIKNAKGDYLIFLDGDDTLTQNSLDILYSTITTNDYDILKSGFQYVWKNKNEIQKAAPKIIGEFSSNEALYSLLDHKITHNLAFAIFKRTLFSQDYVTIDGQKHGEDLILFYQLVARSKKIGVINDITYNYIQDGESSTRSPLSIEKVNQYIKAHNFKMNFLQPLGIKKTAILKNIIPQIFSWKFENNKYNVCIDRLNKEIRQELSLYRALKYMSLMHLIKYYVKSIIKHYIISKNRNTDLFI